MGLLGEKSFPIDIAEPLVVFNVLGSILHVPEPSSHISYQQVFDQPLGLAE